MTYKFYLKVEKNRSSLFLLENGVKLAVVEWPEGRDMGKRLFEEIAELLEKNNLKPEQVNDFAVDSEVSENYTSARIAETIKKMYVFGVKGC